MEKNNKSFEEYLSELETVLRSLEDNTTSLEDAVSNYTKGLELSLKCNEILNKNEQLVVKKMTEAGLVDFNKE